MNWSEEADRVADVVFAEITDRDRVVHPAVDPSNTDIRLLRVNELWTFGERHSRLFDGAFDPNGFCLTQIRSHFPDELHEIPGPKDVILAIGKDTRIPDDCDPLVEDNPTKEEFRKRLEPFVEWRNKLDSLREASHQTG